MTTDTAAAPTSRVGRRWHATYVINPSSITGPVGVTVPLRQRVVPASPSLMLIMKLADCRFRSLPSAFVQGPHSRPVQVQGDTSPPYFRITLSPPSAVRLLGAPLGGLGENLVDLSALFGPDGHRIVELVRDERDRSRQVRLLETFLARRLGHARVPDPAVHHVWRRLLSTRGLAPIGSLAEEIGWTHPRLVDRFRREFGLTPKTAARLVRLQALWWLLDRWDTHRDTPDETCRWAELAALAGYADQSHLIREVRTFTGVTPTDYVTLRGPGRYGGPLITAARDPRVSIAVRRHPSGAARSADRGPSGPA